MTSRAASRGLALLLLLAGCVPLRDAPENPPRVPTGLVFPSELPSEAALSVARATLRRAGWPVGPTAASTLLTGWRETDAGPLRLLVTASDVDGGASTALTVWGETQTAGGATVGVVQPDRAGGTGQAVWDLVEALARQVGAEVRYARP